MYRLIHNFRESLNVLAPLNHENDDGDEKGIDDQCFYQNQAEDQKESNMRGCPGISGYTFEGAADRFGLSKGSRGGRQSDHGSSDDDGPFE